MLSFQFLAASNPNPAPSKAPASPAKGKNHVSRFKRLYIQTQGSAKYGSLFLFIPTEFYWPLVQLTMS